MRPFYHLHSVCVEKCSGHDENQVCLFSFTWGSCLTRSQAASGHRCLHPPALRPQEDFTCFPSVSFFKSQTSLDQRETSNC